MFFSFSIQSYNASEIHFHQFHFFVMWHVDASEKYNIWSLVLLGGLALGRIGSWERLLRKLGLPGGETHCSSSSCSSNHGKKWDGFSVPSPLVEKQDKKTDGPAEHQCSRDNAHCQRASTEFLSSHPLGFFSPSSCSFDSLISACFLFSQLNWILFCATLWSLRPTLANMKSDVSQSKDTRYAFASCLHNR